MNCLRDLVYINLIIIYHLSSFKDFYSLSLLTEINFKCYEKTTNCNIPIILFAKQQHQLHNWTYILCSAQITFIAQYGCI